jgi:hypothetical protein
MGIALDLFAGFEICEKSMSPNILLLPLAGASELVTGLRAFPGLKAGASTLKLAGWN